MTAQADQDGKSIPLQKMERFKSDRPGGRSRSPPENGNLIFILIDSYSESLHRPGGRSTPPENVILSFILIDSYSDTSGRPGGRSSGRSIPPPENGNLTFIMIDSYSENSDSSGRSGGRSSSRSIHPRKWQFDIHTDRFLL